MKYFSIRLFVLSVSVSFVPCLLSLFCLYVVLFIVLVLSVCCTVFVIGHLAVESAHHSHGTTKFHQNCH